MTTAKPRPSLAPGETRTYPVLPLRDIVVFPHMIAPAAGALEPAADQVTVTVVIDDGETRSAASGARVGRGHRLLRGRPVEWRHDGTPGTDGAVSGHGP